MIRVLSYPPRHDYVDRLHGTVLDLVHRTQPWPELPDLYDPDWIVDHSGDWDVAHLHFTWEQYPVERVGDVLEAHRRTGTPVVWTVHDLRNPHTLDPGRDEPYLRLLAQHAQDVVTLTHGAAHEVADRFGRDARVIPHGPLLPPRDLRRWREQRGRRRRGPRCSILLHAKSLRGNVDWRTPMQVAADLAREGAPLELRVSVHDEPGVREAVEPLRAPGVEVRVHPRWDAGELCAQIAAADALLLPYRWGTHSGMVELATDLGVPVLASDVGYLREQAPIVPLAADEAGVEPDSLRAALRRLTDGRQPDVVPAEDRAAALARFLDGHRALYADVSGTT